MRLVLITGARNSGKTELLRRVCAGLPDCGGVLSPAEFIGGVKTRYYAASLRGGRRELLVRLTAKGPVPSPEGFAYASSLIIRNRRRRVLCVDEFGPLEAASGGFSHALAAAAKAGPKFIFMTVRRQLLEQAAGMIGVGVYKVIDLDEHSVEDALRCLLKYAA
ncbi:MAG: hypothetical protein GX410_02240 [Elusimicrobia bacterium]|nr:hypothetical protein [Elusimicrobiota bacterium]